MARMLLLSNSTMANHPYLEWPKNLIKEFLSKFNVKEILFIPFAGVTIGWDEYTEKVQNSLNMFRIKSIHKCDGNYIDAVNKAEAIMIGGGNTFHLLYKLYEFNLLDSIRKRVLEPNGAPYIGWSAGSNVAGPDIGSTNDMPIIWPPKDRALNLVPYNINPHYNEWHPPNLKGETRADRLNECVLIKKRPIVALAEGVAIQIENDKHEIRSPSIDLKCFPDNCDQRCVKVWQFRDDKIHVEPVPLDSGLNAFL